MRKVFPCSDPTSQVLPQFFSIFFLAHCLGFYCPQFYDFDSPLASNASLGRWWRAERKLIEEGVLEFHLAEKDYK